jgi:hypothetical protein
MFGIEFVFVLMFGFENRGKQRKTGDLSFVFFFSCHAFSLFFLLLLSIFFNAKWFSTFRI